jgi:hypothetical protein
VKGVSNGLDSVAKRVKPRSRCKPDWLVTPSPKQGIQGGTDEKHWKNNEVHRTGKILDLPNID